MRERARPGRQRDLRGPAGRLRRTGRAGLGAGRRRGAGGGGRSRCRPKGGTLWSPSVPAPATCCRRRLRYASARSSCATGPRAVPRAVQHEQHPAPGRPSRRVIGGDRPRGSPLAPRRPAGALPAGLGHALRPPLVVTRAQPAARCGGRGRPGRRRRQDRSGGDRGRRGGGVRSARAVVSGPDLHAQMDVASADAGRAGRRPRRGAPGPVRRRRWPLAGRRRGHPAGGRPAPGRRRRPVRSPPPCSDASAGPTSTGPRPSSRPPDPKVVAITGSYGKTTTKGYVAHLVGGSLSVVPSPKSFNNQTGLAKAINENLVPGTDVFVAEMGTYGPGEIAEMCCVDPAGHRRDHLDRARPSRADGVRGTHRGGQVGDPPGRRGHGSQRRQPVAGRHRRSGTGRRAGRAPVLGDRSRGRRLRGRRR